MYYDVKNAQPKTPPKYVPALEDLPASVEKELASRYEFDNECFRMLECRWAPNEDGNKGRLYMPMLSCEGTQIGFVLRTLNKEVIPKAKTFLTNTSSPVYSAYGKGKKGGPLIFVEDQLSAAKTAAVTGLNTVALLGVNLDLYKATEVRKKLEPELVIMALDRDAIRQATSLYTRYRGLFPSIRLLELEQDLKNTKPDEIKGLVRRISG